MRVARTVRAYRGAEVWGTCSQIKASYTIVSCFNYRRLDPDRGEGSLADTCTSQMAMHRDMLILPPAVSKTYRLLCRNNNAPYMIVQASYNKSSCIETDIKIKCALNRSIRHVSWYHVGILLRNSSSRRCRFEQTLTAL
ncbi:unnamed protein product, partial [Brenthis ino]